MQNLTDFTGNKIRDQAALEQYDSLSSQINRSRMKKNRHVIVFIITSKHMHSSVHYVLYGGSQPAMPRKVLGNLEIPVKNCGEHSPLLNPAITSDLHSATPSLQ